ncbi:MAG: AAA family ATPase [Planctomycetota bacterium]
MNSHAKGHDAVDHFAAGYGVDDFLIDEAPSFLAAEPSAAARPSAKNPYDLLTVEDVFRMPETSWIVSGTIPEQGIVIVYGPPGSGKTFVTLDLALTVATGAGQWMGQGAVAGRVLYFMAEGQQGLGKRLRAWGMSEDEPPCDLLFRTEPFQLDDVREVQALCDYLTAEFQDFKLVVFDTLSRNFSGDENSQRDAGLLVQSCDLIRQRLGASVVLVHHSGKVGTVERGSSVFRAAAHTMIQVSKSNSRVTLKCEKQKDGVEFEKIAAGLETVQLAGGETSCRLEHSGAAKSGLPGRQLQILELLHRHQPCALRRCEIHEESGIARQTVSASCKKLLEKGLIQEKDARLTITDDGCNALTISPMSNSAVVRLDSGSELESVQLPGSKGPRLDGQSTGLGGKPGSEEEV